MGLAFNKLDVAGSGIWSYYSGQQGDLFRLASGWMLSRQEIVRLINGFATGPSTTAGTQMNLDSPLFFKALKYWLRIRNPTNNSVRYKLYKCTINHDSTGGTQSIYDESTMSFNVGHNYMSTSLYAVPGNYPGSSFWKFWAQRDRFGAGANSRTTAALQPFLSDQMVMQNDGLDNYPLPPTGDTVVTTAGSLLSAHTMYEAVPAPADVGATSLLRTAFLHRSMPLGRIFPAMRKQLTVRVVASGRLGPYQSKQHRFSHRMPRSVKPLRYILNDTNSTYSGFTFQKGVSHFFIIRAYSPPSTSFDDGGGVSSSNTFLSQWATQAPQLVFDWRKRFECRVAGDSVPNHMVAYDYINGSGGYLGRYQGGFRNGFSYADSTGGAEAQPTVAVDIPSAGQVVYRAPPVHVLWTADGPANTASAATPLYLN